MWHYNLGKCVDATPTVCETSAFGTIVSCGSHSRRLVNVRSTDGHVISELRLPDRIESQVLQHQDHLGLVGCYDGGMYCFEYETGTIRWQFDTGDMIKSRAIVVQRTIVFGNYGKNHNLWGLCAEVIFLIFFCLRSNSIQIILTDRTPTMVNENRQKQCLCKSMSFRGHKKCINLYIGWDLCTYML